MNWGIFSCTLEKIQFEFGFGLLDIYECHLILKLKCESARRRFLLVYVSSLSNIDKHRLHVWFDWGHCGTIDSIDIHWQNNYCTITNAGHNLPVSASAQYTMNNTWGSCIMLNEDIWWWDVTTERPDLDAILQNFARLHSALGCYVTDVRK